MTGSVGDSGDKVGFIDEGESSESIGSFGWLMDSEAVDWPGSIGWLRIDGCEGTAKGLALGTAAAVMDGFGY